jgi:hypothetical protein
MRTTDDARRFFAARGERVDDDRIAEDVLDVLEREELHVAEETGFAVVPDKPAANRWREQCAEERRASIVVLPVGPRARVQMDLSYGRRILNERGMAKVDAELGPRSYCCPVLAFGRTALGDARRVAARLAEIAHDRSLTLDCRRAA